LIPGTPNISQGFPFVTDMVNRLPSRGDLRPIFGREFQGMVVEPVTAEGLKIARKYLISRLYEEVTQGIEDFDNGRDWLTR
jgi:hypothetical protein